MDYTTAGELVKVPPAAGEETREEAEEAMVPPPRRGGKRGRLALSPLTVLRITQAYAVAEYVMFWVYRLRPALPSGRGRKREYSDASVLVISLLRRLWRLSYEDMLAWLQQWPALAKACGLGGSAAGGAVKVISLAQYSRRVRQLGLLPYFLFFVVVVRRLLTLRVLVGYELVLDSTLLAAWSRLDAFAGWSYPLRKLGRVFGYKMHTVLCRRSGLPLLLVVTPANWHDSRVAIGLLWAVKFGLGLMVRAVWADGAYDSGAIRGFVLYVLGAWWICPKNWRRVGKRGLVEWWRMRVWRWIYGKRTVIERFFAFAKRYFGVGEFCVVGREGVFREVLLTNTAILVVAWVAVEKGRYDLRLSPQRVLAHFAG